jgi:leader peptidase (prepilin peptidase)/N-methyltransferase
MWALVIVLGWIAGGLANWLADSLPELNRPERPHCQGCGALRPVPAWLAISALITGNMDCRYCGRPIPFRWLVVEVVGAASAWLIYHFGLGPSGPWMAMLVSWILLLIVIIDFEHRLILHVVTLPSALVLAAGLGIVFVLFLFGSLFARWVAARRGEPLDEVAFGFGDVMLSGVIGLVVGWPGVVLALFLGILAAGLFSLSFLLIQLLRRRYTPYMPFPYGPFLVLGTLLVYLGGRGLFAGLGPG